MDEKTPDSEHMVRLQSTLHDVVQKWQNSSTDALETIGALQNELASSEQDKARLQAAHSTQQRLIQQFVSRERRLRAELQISRAHLREAAAFLQSKVEEESCAICTPTSVTSANSVTDISATASLQVASHATDSVELFQKKQLRRELDRLSDLESRSSHEDDRAVDEDEHLSIIATKTVHNSRASAKGASRAADAAASAVAAAMTINATMNEKTEVEKGLSPAAREEHGKAVGGGKEGACEPEIEEVDDGTVLDPTETYVSARGTDSMGTEAVSGTGDICLTSRTMPQSPKARASTQNVKPSRNSDAASGRQQANASRAFRRASVDARQAAAEARHAARTRSSSPMMARAQPVAPAKPRRSSTTQERYKHSSRLPRPVSAELPSKRSPSGATANAKTEARLAALHRARSSRASQGADQLRPPARAGASLAQTQTKAPGDSQDVSNAGMTQQGVQQSYDRQQINARIAAGRQLRQDALTNVQMQVQSQARARTQAEAHARAVEADVRGRMALAQAQARAEAHFQKQAQERAKRQATHVRKLRGEPESPNHLRADVSSTVRATDSRESRTVQLRTLTTPASPPLRNAPLSLSPSSVRGGAALRLNAAASDPDLYLLPPRSRDRIMQEIALTRDAAADAHEIEQLANAVAELERKAAEASRITELQTSVEALEAEVQQFRAERQQRSGRGPLHARGYGAYGSEARPRGGHNASGTRTADEEASGLSFTQPPLSPGATGLRMSV